MSGLLDGMRVVDLGLWRPTAHATSILCALGAEVLMVEPPGGTPMRAYPQIFAGLAHGKRSVELDLKSDDGRMGALDLLAEADVAIEGWRPGVAARLGLGEPELRVRNAALIICSISGYGQTGPWRDVPGHDLAFQALAGALSPRTDDSSPSIPQLPVADLESGTLAATLVCAAWARRLQTGEGERIDVAMADVVAWWVGPESGTRVAGSGATQPGSPGYGVFRTADGRFIALAALGEPRLWQAICDGLDLDDLAHLPFGDLLGRQAEINQRIATQVASRPSRDLIQRLLDAGAPVAPVHTPEEAVAHPQLRERAIFGTAGDEPVIEVPAHLSAHPRREVGEIPECGEHVGFADR